MTELLVKPYRDGNDSLVDTYFGLLPSFPNLEWIAPDLGIAGTAAQMRVRHRRRTPDALQVATAVCFGATGILTNDAEIARISRIEAGVLAALR